MKAHKVEGNAHDWESPTSDEAKWNQSHACTDGVNKIAENIALNVVYKVCIHRHDLFTSTNPCMPPSNSVVSVSRDHSEQADKEWYPPLRAIDCTRAATGNGGLVTPWGRILEQRKAHEARENARDGGRRMDALSKITGQLNQEAGWKWKGYPPNYTRNWREPRRRQLTNRIIRTSRQTMRRYCFIGWTVRILIASFDHWSVTCSAATDVFTSSSLPHNHKILHCQL